MVMRIKDYDQQSDTYLRDLTIPPAVYLPVGLAILILIVCMCLTAIGCCIRYVILLFQENVSI